MVSYIFKQFEVFFAARDNVYDTVLRLRVVLVDIHEFGGGILDKEEQRLFYLKVELRLDVNGYVEAQSTFVLHVNLVNIAEGPDVWVSCEIQIVNILFHFVDEPFQLIQCLLPGPEKQLLSQVGPVRFQHCADAAGKLVFESGLRTYCSYAGE